MDPSTAIAVIKIIISVAQSLKEIEEQNAFSRWQNEVSSKLDSILRNTDLIIADLKQLRIDFREELKNSFRAEYINRLQGEILNLSAILAPLADGVQLDEATRDRLVPAAERIRTLLYSSVNYGFSTIPLALTGISLLYPTMRLAMFADQEIETTRIQLNQSVLTPSLDEGTVGSFAYALKATREQIALYRNRLGLMVGPVTAGIGLVNTRYIEGHVQDGLIHDIEQYTTVVSGEPEVPESFAATPLASNTIKVGVPGIAFGMFYHWMGTGVIPGFNVDPPLDESGAKGVSRSQCEALRNDFVLKARETSNSLLAENANEINLVQIIACIKDAQ